MAKDFLGQGVKYPIEIDSNGVLQLESGNDLIKQAIRILLDTPVGSSFVNPGFGSEIKSLIGEPNDSILEELLHFFIGDAIEKWEKRVNYLGTKFNKSETEPARINCEVFYNIKSLNEQDSFIYPFYRELEF